MKMKQKYLNSYIFQAFKRSQKLKVYRFVNSLVVNQQKIQGTICPFYNFMSKQEECLVA